MSGEWREVHFSECAKRVSEVVQPGQVAGSTPYIGLEHIVEAGLRLNGHSYSSSATSAKLRFKRGDILFGKLRPYFRKVVRPAFDGVCSTDIWVVRASHGVDQSYLFYLMASEEFIVKASEGSTGTRMPRADWSYLSIYAIPLPPLPEQRRIAKILGDLDDKIELNRKMNETLEQMARALFKSWFIDFDPVRAKMEGRIPQGMDAEKAALFPSRLVESELGMVPEGWEVAEIDSIAETIDCLHSKKPEQVEHGFQMLQLNNIRNDGLVDLTDCYLISEQDYSKWTSRMEATSGDCVITNVGRVGAVAKIPDDMRAALGRNMTGIRCRASFQYPTFLIECLLSSAMREEIARKVDTGTILDALNVKSIPRLRFIRSTNDIVDRFEMIVLPIRKTMEKNLSQSRTLASLRDTLLPQLMRG